LVNISRKALDQSLSFISSNAKTIGEASLLGVAEGDSLRFWQSGFVQVWDSVPLEKSGDFSCSVRGVKFGQIVSACNTETISLSSTDRGVTIRSGKSRVRVPTFVGAWDSIQEPPKVDSFITVSGELVTAFTKGQPFLAKEESQPSLTCFALRIEDGQLRLSSTNGSNMYSHVVDYEGEPNFSEIIVSKEVAQSATKVFGSGDSIQLGVDSNGIIVMMNMEGTRILSAPQFAGVFPDINRIIKAPYNPLFKCKKSIMVDMLKLSSHMTDSKASYMRFESVEDDIQVYFPETDMEYDLYLEGAEIIAPFEKIFLNPGYLSDCISTVAGDEIAVGLGTSGTTLSPLEIKDDSDGNKSCSIIQQIYYSGT
tara:strand:- start:10277 stop:11377 length:1101 start_codon:yes stop_codon:yes gene_type:complete